MTYDDWKTREPREEPPTISDGDMDRILDGFVEMRWDAQSAFGAGVEAMISEIRRFAVAAEGAIGEISIDEAFHGIRRVVSDRVAQLTGESSAPVPLPDAAPSPDFKALYYELLLAVGHKYPGESRHETAMRYIRRAEQSGGPASSASPAAKEPRDC